MKPTLCILAISLALTLSACNTVSGLGQDTEAAGRGLSDTAKDVKGY